MFFTALNNITKCYLSLISFEDCHSPWMLHIETAISVPGLPVFTKAVAAWCVYTELVFGPCTEAPCALNS